MDLMDKGVGRGLSGCGFPWCDFDDMDEDKERVDVRLGLEV